MKRFATAMAQLGATCLPALAQSGSEGIFTDILAEMALAGMGIVRLGGGL